MTRILLPLMLAALLVAAPVALAAKGDDDRRVHRDAEDDDHDEDEKVEKRHARASARANYTENRTALIDAFIVQMQEVRASWHENATRVRETCRGADFDAQNATKEERKANAQCIRDGYAEWHAERRAEIKMLRAEFKALMHALKAERKAASYDA